MIRFKRTRKEMPRYPHLVLKSYVFQIVLILSNVFMGGQSVCNTSKNVLTYIVYPDLHLPGCHQLANLHTGKRTRVACAIVCSTDPNCAAYKFDAKNCFKCSRNNITGINFMSGEFTSLPRVMRERNWPFQSAAVPGGLKAGMVVHLIGLVLSSVDFSINFDQADDMSDINLHFKSGNFNLTTGPFLVLNHRQSNIWGTEIYPVMSPYPFKANTTTRLHILVREDMFVLYIDNKFCCNYTHVVGMLYTKVNNIRVIGRIEVYEISS